MNITYIKKYRTKNSNSAWSRKAGFCVKYIHGFYKLVHEERHRAGQDLISLVKISLVVNTRDIEKYMQTY